MCQLDGEVEHRPVGRRQIRLTVVLHRGPNEIVLEDVLVGEVWLCSGQSNMEMGVKVCLDPEEEIAAAVRSVAGARDVRVEQVSGSRVTMSLRQLDFRVIMLQQLQKNLQNKIIIFLQITLKS